MITASRARDQSCSGIQHRLQLAQQTVRQPVEQQVAVIQLAGNKRRSKQQQQMHIRSAQHSEQLSLTQFLGFSLLSS